jgi:predicted nucleic acid-binding protein
MRLVADASVLVGELLRAAGRDRLGDDRLELFLPERVWGEVRHELPRRTAAFARRRAIGRAEADDLVGLCLDAVEANVSIVEEAVYAPLEDEARARALRDPDDWPLVACALALAAGIWTVDNDLLGTGVATWTTESLRVWLDRHPTGTQQ